MSQRLFRRLGCLYAILQLGNLCLTGVQILTQAFHPGMHGDVRVHRRRHKDHSQQNQNPLACIRLVFYGYSLTLFRHEVLLRNISDWLKVMLYCSAGKHMCQLVRGMRQVCTKMLVSRNASSYRRSDTASATTGSGLRRSIAASGPAFVAARLSASVRAGGTELSDGD